ncbi:hypothetical protein P154DRAFT_538122 [Amniculicola lignicola CBS 123094]|uniref:Uncharacterized protein n=1 Tax=Amniculicola lignicola CBS 123094 TaxID=1392246 RepID=A0A6A5W5B6_9PLEO|nr:hypothetical protein P154DRAFT_538122 [Amniculicola lignicola CBS 123094]
MYTKGLLAAVIFAAVSTLPSCSAPAPVIPQLLGGVAGTVIDVAAQVVPLIAARDVKNTAGQVPNFPGVPAYNVQMCMDSTKGVSMDVDKTSETSYRIKGVPPPCMVLAGAFVNDKSQPIPCGNDCLEYVNLSPKDVDMLEEVIEQLS